MDPKYVANKTELDKLERFVKKEIEKSPKIRAVHDKMIVEMVISSILYNSRNRTEPKPIQAKTNLLDKCPDEFYIGIEREANEAYSSLIEGDLSKEVTRFSHSIGEAKCERIVRSEIMATISNFYVQS